MARTASLLPHLGVCRGLIVWSILATASLLPRFNFAAEQAIPFHGQADAIFVDGNPMVHWIGDPAAADAELVLVWTDSAPGAVNTLRTTHKIDMRILTIGGGGAGGFGTTGATNSGGGGERMT